MTPMLSLAFSNLNMLALWLRSESISVWVQPQFGAHRRLLGANACLLNNVSPARCFAFDLFF